MGHLQPANLTDINKKSISKIVMQAINAIGIDNSASHIEIKLTKEGPKVIEIGARLGGDFISSYLTLHSCGVNLDKAAIDVALGQSPDLQVSQNCFSYIRYLELPEGKTIRKLLPLDNIKKLPGVVFVWIFVKPDDIVKPIVHSALRPACILVKADSREDVIAMADRYINKLKELIITN
jgi:biotin carboxylase